MLRQTNNSGLTNRLRAQQQCALKFSTKFLESNKSLVRCIKALMLIMVQLVVMPLNCFAASKFTLIGQVSTSPSVNYVVEAGIVVILFGGALFAICKTSYRR